MGLKVEDITALTNLELDVEKIPNDDPTMLELHTEFKNYMNKYVPMDSGTLRSTAFATPKYVEYPQSDYAHYMYEGIVYGSNIPKKDAQGNIIGWVSPPGKGSKHPTGNEIKYSKPLATHHWDKALMANEGEKFTKALAIIINRKLKEDIDK